VTSPLPEVAPNGQPWPRASIVTPSYNQGEFLEETIRSVLLQGYPDLEYIVVDGGSSDDSVEVIRRYEPWLACWVSEPDRGQSTAVNKGWQRATGELLAYLNSDDLYLPGAVAGAAGELVSNPSAAMVHSDAMVVDPHGNKLYLWPSHPFDLAEMLCNWNYIRQPAALLRRAAIESVGFLDESLHMVMDYDLWLRIGLRFPIVYVRDACWAAIRTHHRAKTRARYHELWPELECVLERTFRDPALPPGIRGLYRRAIGRIYFGYIESDLRHPPDSSRPSARGVHGQATSARWFIHCLIQARAYLVRHPLLSAYALKEFAMRQVRPAHRTTSGKRPMSEGPI
jgi:glycosyltransferase involved in cell wall biosynthesis